jgi:hypothetical protein
MPTLDSVTIEVLNTLDQISIDPVESTSIIQLEENSPNLVVELSTVDPASLVKSVNGRTGNVVINYSDIAGAPDWATTNGSSNAAPVNQVRFVYTQNAPASQWTINHNLGFFPNITVLDNQNRLLEVHIEYLNTNAARIVMNSACSGVAYLT